jgi:adenylate kinase family enzyme
MQRVMVVGCAGAGKSTVARALADRLQLPVIHLDQHYWQPGWIEPDENAWRQQQRTLAAADHWIIDGNYSSTVEERLNRADAILILDLPRMLCLFRVLRRWTHWRGRIRPDMPAGCPERVDLQFLRYIWLFPRLSRPELLAKIATHNASGTLIRLTSRSQVTRWLRAL